MRMAPASSGVQRHPAEYKAEPLSPPPAAQGPFRAARSLGPCARGFGAGGARRAVVARGTDKDKRPREFKNQNQKTALPRGKAAKNHAL